MPIIPTQTVAWPTKNTWQLANGVSDFGVTMPKLLHAAVTAGHGRGWLPAAKKDIAGKAELLWKLSAFQATVCEQSVRIGGRNLPRLMPTTRFQQMDPSERRALTYHLGMAIATAWARERLQCPWVLHLDVYRTMLNPNLLPGDSRPDLVGRTLGGDWISMECKGRSSSPDNPSKAKAIAQAQRLIAIGGVPPSLHLAMFSFFGPESRASGRTKPRVVKLCAIDPPAEGESVESISLPLLDEPTFFRLYYEPWQLWFKGDAKLVTEGRIKWRVLDDLGLRIGILPELKKALDQESYRAIPKILIEEETFSKLSLIYPSWTGDGIFLEFDPVWRFDQMG